MRASVLFVAVLVVAVLQGWAQPRVYSPACGLGVRWDTVENGWTGTWVRRGNSSTFDATWRKGGDSGSSILTMSLSGNRVHVERRDAANFGGSYVEYDGTIAADGTVSGTGRVASSGSTYPFHAVVRCDERTAPPPDSATCGLGVQWDTAENGWTGTWVRRGNGNTFDAAWRKGGDSGSSTLTMSLTGNRVHVERRDAANFGGSYVEYDGTIAADGTVSGTGRLASSGSTYPFRAVVRCR